MFTLKQLTVYHLCCVCVSTWKWIIILRLVIRLKSFRAVLFYNSVHNSIRKFLILTRKQKKNGIYLLISLSMKLFHTMVSYGMIQCRSRRKNISAAERNELCNWKSINTRGRASSCHNPSRYCEICRVINHSAYSDGIECKRLPFPDLLKTHEYKNLKRLSRLWVMQTLRPVIRHATAPRDDEKERKIFNHFSETISILLMVFHDESISFYVCAWHGSSLVKG